MLEFALMGIPLIFIWISIVQIAFGMWQYHTLQYAVKMAGAYIAVHGAGCASPNTCSIQIENAAQVLANAATGMPPSQISVTFRAYLASDHTTVSPTSVSCTLDSCLTNTTPWPPAGYNTATQNDVEIHASYLFRSALGMFVPGSGSVQFGSYYFPAETQQMILF
ncbi:MAG: TadE family protein [Bryobacteraceae bacterium]|jgi:hypothetical protein